MPGSHAKKGVGVLEEEMGLSTFWQQQAIRLPFIVLCEQYFHRQVYELSVLKGVV